MIDKYVMAVDSGEFFTFIDICTFTGYPYKTTRTPQRFCACRIEENKEYLHRCKDDLLKMGIDLDKVVIRNLETVTDIKVFGVDKTKGLTEQQRSNAWLILKNSMRLVIEGNEYPDDKKELAKGVLALMEATEEGVTK